MKKGKRLSKADALRVLRRAYNLIKNDNGNDHPDIVERVARKIRSIF